MSKPTAEELKIALDEAIRLRENDIDHHFMAKAVLNLNYRMAFMEKVLQTAKDYLHSGLSGQGQTELMFAIEKAEKASVGKAYDEHTYITGLKDGSEV